MFNHRIALIQVWLGELPDYFEYHYTTCLNQPIDFFIFTDQQVDPKFNAPNVKFIGMNLSTIEKRLFDKTGKSISIKNSYKVCDIRPAYLDIFEEYINGYEFAGWYDIDTLLGDVLSYIKLDAEYDVFSFGQKNTCYDRLSGPLTIMRNTLAASQLYKTDPKFYSAMKVEEYSGYDEAIFTETLISNNYRINVINDVHNLDPITLKIGFDAVWSGGKVYIDGEEKLLHHFYRKKYSKLERIGNTIVCNRKFEYMDDFLWVTYFTENYEPIVKTLIESLSKYSQRKCILYSVNYTSSLQYALSDQFIVRRIDISSDNDWLDDRGRSFNTITCKPLINLDSIYAFPGKKFIFLDTDIYVTNSIDDAAKYFIELENYPLTNSHVHDVIYIHENNEHISSLHSLTDELGVDVTIFPRRKTNVMLYDERASWFFTEQMQIYNEHKDSTRIGIFRLHDEDTFNAILCKYKLQNSLPVVDIEEGYTIDVNRFYTYSYNYTQISELARVPKTNRDIYAFHGYKNPTDWDQINELYCKTVIDLEDLLIEYNGTDLALIKNSFFIDKKIERTVNLKVLDGTQVIFTCPLEMFDVQLFYVWNLYLEKGRTYLIELSELTSDRLVFRKQLTIT